MIRLWDGATLEVSDWMRHGDEYVVTLPGGEVRVLRQQDIREIVPEGDEDAHAGRDEAPVPGR